VADDADQRLDIGSKPRFTPLVEGHCHASHVGPQAFPTTQRSPRTRGFVTQ
jgi:hypothetical protein